VTIWTCEIIQIPPALMWENVMVLDSSHEWCHFYLSGSAAVLYSALQALGDTWLLE
jgi:hypothetical protein